MTDDGERRSKNEFADERDPAPFSRSANAKLRYLMVAVAAFFCIGVYSWYAFARSDYVSTVGQPIEQPVLFSHRHHAGELGIDCRYCHVSVEQSSFAGIPPTETCMSCHSQLFTDSVMLTQVRESFVSGNPIAWNRVHDLPEYVYFDHSIHINKGVQCVDCHGDVANMALAQKQQPLYMKWCLDCHQQHEPTELSYPEFSGANKDDASGSGQVFVQPGEINALTNCYTCHR